MNVNNDSGLTTSQAAELLEAHESSIKRWCNEGFLKSHKTSGGHRRIGFDQLILFARKKLPEADLLGLSPFEAETAKAVLDCREHNNYQPLVNLILKMCVESYPEHLTLLIEYAKSVCRLPLVRLFDLGLGQALRRVGNEWAGGNQSIAHEHRLTQKVMDALHGHRRGGTPLPDSSAPLALVGCAESSYHEIGAMMARLTLEEAGWQVCYLGSNVPFSEYAGLQADLGAALVAISFIPPCGDTDARRCLAILSGMYRNEQPYFLALGGGGLQSNALEKGPWPFLDLKVVSDTETLQTWAKKKQLLLITPRRRKTHDASNFAG